MQRPATETKTNTLPCLPNALITAIPDEITSQQHNTSTDHTMIQFPKEGESSSSRKRKNSPTQPEVSKFHTSKARVVSSTFIDSHRDEDSNRNPSAEPVYAMEQKVNEDLMFNPGRMHIKTESVGDDILPDIPKSNMNTNVDQDDNSDKYESGQTINFELIQSAGGISDNEREKEVHNQHHQHEEEEEEEEEYKPPEPDYKKANAIRFSKLCKRLEAVWKERAKKSNKQSKNALLDSLLPKALFRYLNGGSPFPFLRLMLPDRDTLRPHSGMKEKTIACAWGDALGLSKTSADYKKLTNYNDPLLAGPTACGDLSIAVKEVMEKRYHHQSKDSTITVGGINDLLDELANVKRNTQQKNKRKSVSVPSGNNSTLPRHDQEQLSSLAYSGVGPLVKKHEIKVRWVQTLFRKRLSPLEHKWVVRILLQKLELGVGPDSIINYYHPWANGLYSANKNIRTLCATLSDPEFIRIKKKELERYSNQIESNNRNLHLPKSSERASLGSTLSPMLSARTTFSTFLTDIQKRHKSYTDALPKDDPLRKSLTLKYPTFVCEIKLDGERILAHVKKSIIKLQTRNAVWYSNLYSPILGPSLRRCIGEFDVDIILDGEVIAWDNGRKEVIPFGANRTVAKARREWCERHGKIDKRDLNLHEGDGDGVNAVSTAVSEPEPAKQNLDYGEDCWLKYVIFDVLYVGGPDAYKVIKQSYDMLNKKYSQITPGSLIDLDLYHRKVILHSLITPQENLIEIVDSMVIRSDGSRVDGSIYFSGDLSYEYGYSPLVLDSINCTLDGDITNFQEIDTKRKGRRTDTDIDEERAEGLDCFYNEIVGRRCLEGLVLKDMSTPYGLGNEFRNKGYWFKLKDDYEQHGHAADIDVIVLGASFATGMSKAGLLNQFLVGCLDSDTSDGLKFMTLCNISGGGTSRANLDRLLHSTGFHLEKETGQINYGKWFEGDGSEIPDFISNRSFQRSMNSDNDGWKFKRMHYPNLWIRPEDSFAFTVNAGEIVSSDDHSAGVSLRFPRISRIRARGFDGGPKRLTDIETVADLHDLYFKRQSQQKQAESQGSISFSQIQSQNTHSCKFLTMSQNIKTKKSSRRRSSQTLEVQVPRIPVASIESLIFKGYTFIVLDGSYFLDEECLDAQEASKQGWLDEATQVKCRDDVVKYILKHSGKCELTANEDTDFIIGGKSSDARVAIHLRAVDCADKTNKSGNFQKKTKLNGVLKWTFLFSIIHKVYFEAENNEVLFDAIGRKHTKGKRHVIKELFPDLIVPRRHDFLGLSKISKELMDKIQNTYEKDQCEELSLFDFKRSLDEVRSQICSKEKQKIITKARGSKIKQVHLERNELAVVPWQYRGISSFDEDEQWIFSGSRQKFWKTSSGSPMVLYPDLFEDDFGFEQKYDAMQEVDSRVRSSQWDRVSKEQELSDVASSLPLAKAMGAQVTPHLHCGVTHILCDLKQSDTVNWRPQVSSNIFRDSCRGKKLLKRITSLQSEVSSQLTFISPRWVKQKWC